MKKAEIQNIELLKMATAGSVDDGKSTLIGRLLHECDAIYKDQFSALKKSSKTDEDIDFSHVLDGLSSERAQGITIDVAYRYFSTSKRRFIVADVPGHEQYTPNMVTGMSNVNLAMILVDATKGLTIQTKRHLFIATLLGVSHILVAVNKMDLVDYKESVFEKIRDDFKEYIPKLNIKDIQYVPVSALSGDNITTSSESMPWYQGGTILNYLENIEVSVDGNLIDFRFPIQCVVRFDKNSRGYAGRVESGIIKKGEKIVVLPSGKFSKIKSIIYNEKEQDYAFTPQSIVITLEDEIDIDRGDMLARKNNTPNITQSFEAMMAWFSDEPLDQDKQYIIKTVAGESQCFVDEIRYKINVDTLHRETSNKINFNEIGRVNIKTSQPVMIDDYSKNHATGSFIVIDKISKKTVGAGVVTLQKTGEVEAQKSDNLEASDGGVLWFTGLSGSGKSTIADRIFEFLKQNNIPCERLDGDVLRKTLCKDLGFTKQDRYTNIERAGFIAKTLSRHGVIVVASFISPYEEQRENLKKEIDHFVEIFMDTPLDICKKRDAKGLYEKAEKGEIPYFTGVSDPYEVPKNPGIRLDGRSGNEEELSGQVVDYLLENSFLKNR